VTVLLDANVLVALAFPAHVHHDAVHSWRTSLRGFRFATCPITQGTLIRMALREGASADQAKQFLRGLVDHPRHSFWPDDIEYASVRLSGVVGHRQVTDAYLAALARVRGERLATLDSGLAALHADVADLLPTS
jgi:toxin-antitoxin system PIN domain toxin